MGLAATLVRAYDQSRAGEITYMKRVVKKLPSAEIRLRPDQPNLGERVQIGGDGSAMVRQAGLRPGRSRRALSAAAPAPRLVARKRRADP